MLVIIVCCTLLLRFEASPGPSAGPARHWPQTTRITRSDRPALLVFVHPKCPCTRATLAELDRVLARIGDRADAHVLFVRPRGVAAGWERSDLWAIANAIPGVRVDIDEHGAEAKRFGAVTSGHTFLYGPDGRLEFSGGITAARGHAGDNAGEDAIVSVLAAGTSDQANTSVFGCALLNDTDASED